MVTTDATYARPNDERWREQTFPQLRRRRNHAEKVFRSTTCQLVLTHAALERKDDELAGSGKFRTQSRDPTYALLTAGAN